MSNFKRYLSKSCLLSIMLAASMNIYSQITLNVNATSVKSVINQIEKQSDYRFFFEDNLPGLSKEIDINVEDQSINQVLDEICSQAGISYTIKGDKQVVIHAAKTASVQQSSNKTIKGVVVDNAGIPIIGANIMVKGTTNGTITDMDGNFTLDVPAGAVLQISYIGYANQEVKVGNSSNLSITLKEDTETLDEVVVVGYGTQKKINLTGSTSVVTSKDLVKRVTPNAANMLQGKASGLQITSTSGQPGNDDANIRIRGIGTFGAGSNPLILVDGVEGELSSLNSNDIESVTVLKDAASAAIYGSRAANGVILVTTKKGTKGFSVEYTGNFQVQKAASRNLVTNSADYMEAYNEARVRSSQPLIFTEEEINNFRNGTDPIKYPNFDWEKHMIKPAFMHSHHISVKGGDEKTKYNLSLGYLSQDGITDGFDYDRINGLVNISSKLSKYVTVGANLNLQYSDRNSPVSGKGGNVGEQIFLIYAAAPNFMPKLPDGSDRWARTYKQAQPANRNPEAVLAIGNRNHKTYSLNSQVFADVQLLDNLTWSTKMAVNYKDVFFKQNERNDIKMYNYNDGSVNLTACGYNLGLRNQSLKNLFLTVYSTLQYSLKVGNHDLTILGGYSQEKSSNRNLDAYRPNMPFNDLTEINAGSAENQTLGGGLEEWALRSFFGRLNYSFKNRYLFEANVRYDGTSRMSPDHRWGVFPSFSAGWRLSEEKFMKRFSKLDNLKIRASWGQLGNQNIGAYPYQSVYDTGLLYPFGSTAESGVAVTSMVDRNLGWEKTTEYGAGVDFSYNKGLFSFSLDGYKKITTGILSKLDIPASIGLGAPTTNFAEMQNVGFDLELGHRNRIGEVDYSVSANISHFTNTVNKVVAPSYGITTVQIGHPYGSYYLVTWDGIFQNEDEIKNSPYHPNNPKPGDLKFKDTNGDNKINADDRTIHDGAFPDFYYGINMDVSWKNFDLNLFFQGVQGQKHYVVGGGAQPFTAGGAPTKEFYENCWREDRPTNEHPAMYQQGYAANMGTPNTYYLVNASYFKLKSFNLGYTLPRPFVNRIGIDNIRIFLTGDNVFTITKYPYGDPDRNIKNADMMAYPQVSSYSLGVQIKF